jgi:hypothetical protein
LVENVWQIENFAQRSLDFYQGYLEGWTDQARAGVARERAKRLLAR